MAAKRDAKNVDGCPSGPTGLNQSQTAAAVALFRALGDETRVRLLSIIAASPNGEACICNLTGPVGLSQPTVSHHMRVLTDTGVVIRDQRGKWAYFTIAPQARDLIASALKTVLVPPHPAL